MGERNNSCLPQKEKCFCWIGVDKGRRSRKGGDDPWWDRIKEGASVSQKPPTNLTPNGIFVWKRKARGSIAPQIKDFIQMKNLVQIKESHPNKTSPQAKRHKPSLHIISLHFFSLLCLILLLWLLINCRQIQYTYTYPTTQHLP